MMLVQSKFHRTKGIAIDTCEISHIRQTLNEDLLQYMNTATAKYLLSQKSPQSLSRIPPIKKLRCLRRRRPKECHQILAMNTATAKNLHSQKSPQSLSRTLQRKNTENLKKYSQKRHCAATVPIPTFMFL
jgi:hypothetical protein